MIFPEDVVPREFQESWQAFEALASVAYGRVINISFDNIHLNQILIGESSVRYQCDVVITISENEKLVIEVKSGQQEVTREVMDAFIEKIRDLGEGTRGIFIVENRFQRGAILKADYRNVEIYILTESRTEHWEGRIERININLNMIIPQIVNFNVAAKARNKQEKGNLMRGIIDSRNTYIEISGEIETIKEFVLRAPVGKNQFKFSEATAFLHFISDDVFELKEVSFEKKINTITRPILIQRREYSDYIVLQNPQNLTDCIIFPKDELFQDILRLVAD